MRADWSKTTIRAAAILALLAGTACQRNEGDASSGGMFGTGGAKNGSVANAAPGAAQPAVQPQQPAAQPMTPPSAPVATPDPAATPAGPVAQDRRIRVNNGSSQTITLIKGSATSDSDWGRDRIPTGVLRPGGTVTIDFNDGNGECVYDLQATLQDGTLRVRRGVDVCRVIDWVVTDDGSEVR